MLNSVNIPGALPQIIASPRRVSVYESTTVSTHRTASDCHHSRKIKTLLLYFGGGADSRDDQPLIK